MDLKEEIQDHPFLEGLSEKHVELLARFAMKAHFAADELIFREGDPANRFYLIQSGKVALGSLAKGKGNVLTHTIGAGDVLGWSWLFAPYTWHFDARALEPTDAIFLYATPLRALCEEDHDLGYELLRRMSEVMLSRLQATRRQLLERSGVL